MAATPWTELVAAAVEGDREALETLVVRHQPWIYNLIVTNHVLNMKARGYEEAITGFDAYYSFVEQIPDTEPDDSPEMALITGDLKIGCVMGTLLCLDRTQRLAFILTAAFGATDRVGSELLGISRDSFRKTLSRARGKLRQYMSGSCGLVNPDAPCRCRNKVQSFVDSGAYSVERLNYLVPNRRALPVPPLLSWERPRPVAAGVDPGPRVRGNLHLQVIGDGPGDLLAVDGRAGGVALERALLVVSPHPTPRHTRGSKVTACPSLLPEAGIRLAAIAGRDQFSGYFADSLPARVS